MEQLLQHYALRTLWFLCIFVFVSSGPVWLAVLLGLGYVLVYRGLEVLALAFLVDAYFGYGAEYPYLYTITTIVLLVAVRCAETYITVYNRAYGTKS